MNSKIKILKEVPKTKIPNAWNLCFQKCIYTYDQKADEEGFRFIWKDEKGNLRPQRGQARIPSNLELQNLLNEAMKDGWLK